MGMSWAAPPRVIAHRGASAQAPENTMASFRRALEAGARAVELDVHLTRDGVPVVIHDSEVDRTTDGTGFVHEHALEDLRKLDAGAWYGGQFAGERVPTLEEALAFCKGRLLVNVEVKPGLHAVPARVSEVAHRLGVLDQIAVTSFDPDMVRAFHQLHPRVPTGVILAGEPEPAEVRAYRPFAQALGLFCEVATPDVVGEMRDLGFRVMAWTVNDPEEAQRLLDGGVEGVITDDPAALLPVTGP